VSGPVCVVGSLNDDITLQVSALPAPGETILTAGRRRQFPGGKGANQAAAAAAFGARVAMVGAVGADEPGERSVAALAAVGVDVSGVRRHDLATGTAVVVVDADGENTIVVDPGANGTLTPAEVRDSVTSLAPAVVLAQLEVPLDAVAAAVRASPGATVVLNPAPMPADPGPVRDLLSHVGVLVPNRGELGRLAGRPEPGTPDAVVDCVRSLDLPGAVVVTLGADGALCIEGGSEPVVVPGERVATVDASGAGDVFCGCLAAQLAAGVPLVDAVRRANTAAAQSTTFHGARVPVGFRA
jgi:ribokinase